MSSSNFQVATKAGTQLMQTASGCGFSQTHDTEIEQFLFQNSSYFWVPDERPENASKIRALCKLCSSFKATTDAIRLTKFVIPKFNGDTINLHDFRNIVCTGISSGSLSDVEITVNL